MSGGSWDYISYRLDDVIVRLGGSDDVLRRLMSRKVAVLNKALHSIEWVDSGDKSEGDEIEDIRAFLEFDIGEAIREEIESIGARAHKDIDILLRLCDRDNKD